VRLLGRSSRRLATKRRYARVAVIQVPPPDTSPSARDLVADWMEASLVHGPGDLRGQPTESTTRNRLISGPATMSSS
jgi:hypothetical protein